MKMEKVVRLPIYPRYSSSNRAGEGLISLKTRKLYAFLSYQAREKCGLAICSVSAGAYYPVVVNKKNIHIFLSRIYLA